MGYTYDFLQTKIDRVNGACKKHQSKSAQEKVSVLNKNDFMGTCKCKITFYVGAIVFLKSYPTSKDIILGSTNYLYMAYKNWDRQGS